MIKIASCRLLSEMKLFLIKEDDMATYYLAWHDITFTNNQGYDKHLYLVRDDNGNLSSTSDQTIIRGGAENNGFFDFIFGQTGALIVEPEVSSANSRDGLDNTGNNDGDAYLNNDKDKDGDAD